MEAAVVAIPAAATDKKDNLIHSEVKLFNRWSFDGVQVNDMSLEDYVAVTAAKHATFVPHTAGRYSVKRFRKAQCPIIERLTNSLMMHGRNNGKKLMAVRIIKHAMEIIHLLTDLNPIQVIVDAVINSGPREDATRIGSAGVVRRQAVDISPLRRVNQAIYLLTTGARESAFRNIKTIAECLADELINAAKGSSNSSYDDIPVKSTSGNGRAVAAFASAHGSPAETATVHLLDHGGYYGGLCGSCGLGNSSSEQSDQVLGQKQHPQ
ncbi:ribosomal protein 5B [Actinidia rufa]|uniref:Ribosomal protein 5B n=1 Tax=Actinidia rufa TaxID=165716 RepID=A0A7J0E2I2_9ERIC|nr:ribosomal protein 5B [Actinidia rufa]